MNDINLVRVNKSSMKNRDNRKHSKQVDPHLDTPAEANMEKHINFVEMEGANESDRHKDDFSEKRREKWQKGIEEGERERQNSEKD
jgi:hypothetical protein